jgi:hypothetical protein
LIVILKLKGSPLNYGVFKLGRWGILINLFAILYTLYVTVWVCFPVVLPVTAATMNYALPLWIAVFLFALGRWFLGGNKKFKIRTWLSEETEGQESG